MWNDTLAYLITFRSYGTWLHGDKRGSIDRFHNRYRSPYLPRSDRRLARSQALLKRCPVVLNPAQRRSISRAIREVCGCRHWPLHALNVRTNHVHAVVSSGTTGAEDVRSAFKAYATRKMRKNGTWAEAHTPWALRGSSRCLWNEESIARAIDYVINGQGDDLPDFD